VRSMETQERPPVGVAAFIGREVERGKVGGLVVDARVVTLTGQGVAARRVWRWGLPGTSRRASLADPGGWTCRG